MIIGNEKFTDNVVRLYNVYFNNGEHEICYISKTDSVLFSKPDVVLKQYDYILDNKMNGFLNGIKLVSFIKKYDYIVLHSMGAVNNFLLKYFCLNKSFTNKHIVWVEWGYDLYDFQLPCQPSIRERIGFWIEKQVRNSVNSVVGIFPPDCKEYKKRYPNSKANVYYAPYIGLSRSIPVHYDKHFCRLRQTLCAKEPIYIQVGHNGQRQLNHLETLRILTKYSDENIRLFLPLSYSVDDEYVLQIKKYLELHFKGKYIILDNFMPQNEYYQLIDRIDISIFNTYRQTALGNIHRMIRNNIKLYMPADSVMFDYFTSKDIPITDIKKIEKMNFYEFTSIPDWESIDGPEKYIDELNDFSTRLSYWEKIYDNLRVALHA